MPRQYLDPSPRSYVAAARLLKRAAGRTDLAADGSSAGDVEAWLLGAALDHDDVLPLFHAFIERLVGAGLPLDRVSLHVGTLHPQIYGFGWIWERNDGLCDEIKVSTEALAADSYRRNPLFQVIENGERFRADPRDAATAERYPLMGDLAKRGFTDYLAVPLQAGGAYHNAATIATTVEMRFTDAQLGELRRLFRLFALHVQRHIAMRVSANVLETYLGAAAGGKVLDGSIRRGTGERIRAVIWVSDLRGFTDLSDRLSEPDMLALLNQYFGLLVGAVIDSGGEVLKFIGDGLLAVFPFATFETEANAAKAAFDAARGALDALEAFNNAPDALQGIDGWRPLRSGIALHEGEVFFGNMGATERLDFTVIGAAVNTASRVEGLCKTLGQPLLITEPVATRLSEPLQNLGIHTLRGVTGPVAVYCP